MVLKFFIFVNLCHNISSILKKDDCRYTSKLKNLILLVRVIGSTTPLLLLDDAFDEFFVFGHILDKYLIYPVLSPITITAPCLPIFLIGDPCCKDTDNEFLPGLCHFLQHLLKFRRLSDFYYLSCQMRLESVQSFHF
jgi:hypothetical protein